MSIKAIIFDVDGTLADTEDAHRIAFNKAFAENHLNWNWDVALYDKLLKVTGGKLSAVLCKARRLRRFRQALASGQDWVLHRHAGGRTHPPAPRHKTANR